MAQSLYVGPRLIGMAGPGGAFWLLVTHLCYALCQTRARWPALGLVSPSATLAEAAQPLTRGSKANTSDKNKGHGSKASLSPAVFRIICKNRRRARATTAVISRLSVGKRALTSDLGPGHVAQERTIKGYSPCYSDVCRWLSRRTSAHFSSM